MAQATSTTLGEIKLAGDLAGSNNALLPELTATGVVPGAYALPKITVDAKGRVLTAANSTSADILALFPDATKVSKGVVQVGDNINVTITATAANQTVFFNPGLTDTQAVGFCTNAVNYSATFVVDGIPYNYSVAGSSLTTIKSLRDSITAFIPVTGFMTLVDGNLVFNGASGSGKTVAITNDNLFRFISGFTSIGAAINGSGSSAIWVYDASTTQKGVVRAGTGLTVADGLMSVDTSSLVATSSSAGLVRIGQGISVNNGVISAEAIADATSSSKGLVQVGTNIDVANGVISIPDGSTTVKGVVRLGNGLVSTNGVVDIDTSMHATNTTPGLIKVGSGLVANTGVLRVNTVASGSSLGLVRIGAGVSVDANGIISTTAGAIADATSTSKGLVQVGSGIAVADGVISVQDANATANAKGVVSVNTANGLTIASGVLGVAPATSNTFGVVKSANVANISITSGLVDVGSNIAKLDTANTYSKAQVVAISTIGSGSSITPDFALSNTFYMDANQNFTLNAPINVVAGGTYYIIVKQDATGGRMITWDAVFKFRGLAPALTDLPNKSDIISMIAAPGGVLLTEVLKGFD